MLAGTAEEFDSDLQREIATVEVDQAIDLSAAMNHPLAIDNSSPSDRRPLLANKNTDASDSWYRRSDSSLRAWRESLRDFSGCELMTLDGDCFYQNWSSRRDDRNGRSMSGFKVAKQFFEALKGSPTLCEGLLLKVIVDIKTIKDYGKCR